jgi:hypothetical protein
MSADKFRKMGIPLFEPYKDTEHKRLRTRLGEFTVESFPVPHNGCENRGFLIKTEEQTICFMTDLEYCPYDLSSQKIDTMIIELNYQEELISDIDEHRRHVVLGHCSESTTIGILKQNIKYLKNVILIHMSTSGYLNRNIAMKRIREEIPEYINVCWAKPNTNYNISLIPF